MLAIKNYAVFLPLCLIGVHALYAAELPYMEHHVNIAAEAVFMNRSPVKKRCVAIDPNKIRFCDDCDNFCVQNTRDLRFDYDPGYRIKLFCSKDAKRSFEAVFLWIQPWEAEKQITRDQHLEFPFRKGLITFDHVDARTVHETYDSCFWDAEANYWHHFSPRHIDFFSLSGILGLRYFHLNENFILTYIKPPDKSHYRIHTDNDIGGMQIGLNLQIAPTRKISWDFTGKVGVMLDRAYEKSEMSDLNDRVIVSDFRQERWQIGFFSELLGQVAYQFAKHLDVHVGIEFIYLSGIALAPEQVNRNLIGSNREVYTHGATYIYGLYGGFSFGF